jgi:hypothetical protein
MAKEIPGLRDGTGPYKGSYQASVSKIGRRKMAGEICPFEDKETPIKTTVLK